MTNARATPTSLHRRDPAVSAVALAWRRLTGGGGAPMLVACSGGADSTALALCLHAAGASITLGHVLHDMRAPAVARVDRDAVARLAASLGAPFCESSVTVTGQGNIEAAARRRRYAALAAMASEAGLAFVATGHQADDQFESVVMALVRGAGPAGLAGAAPRRRLGPGVALIRPMLALSHAEALRLCTEAGVAWREDETNLDASRLRAALRHGPLADVERIRPGAAGRAARSAMLLRDAAGLVRDRAAVAFGDVESWDRAALRSERAIVVGAGLRRAALLLTSGQWADRLTGRLVDPAVRAVRDHSTEPRVFEWPGAIALEVTARVVRMSRREMPQ